MKVCLALCAILLISTSLAASKEDWKTRTIYQVLTDRFARPDGDTAQCGNLSNYCGGGWAGITNNLGYISGLGFDAIWISPIVENTDGGYHGYWAKDINSLNSNYGSEQDFVDMVTACHKADVWIMLDVVGNHMGPVGDDFGQLSPFNQAEHYHSDCDISSQDFASHNMDHITNCRLAGLPDLNQGNQYVHDTLTNWIKDLVSKYQLDGIRIDTVPEVEKSFWSDFTQASGVYSVGEVFDGDMGYVAGYQGSLDAVLNYPLFFTLRGVFQQGQSANNIQGYYQSASAFSDPTVLGVFIDNHDNARFLNGNGNIKRFQNALAFSLLAEGIPIVYYGDEQAYAGGNDPNNREVLWTTLKNTDSEMYLFTQLVVNYRRSKKIWAEPQVQSYADDNFYAFYRGDTVAAFSNTDNQLDRDLTTIPYGENELLCNIFDYSDCVTVTDGKMHITLKGGEVKVFTPERCLNKEEVAPAEDSLEVMVESLLEFIEGY